jgi:tRNA-modifying protein YgfZ
VCGTVPAASTDGRGVGTGSERLAVVVVRIVVDEKRSLGEDLRVLENGAGWLPLGGDVLLRVTGKGHLEVLQRVVSQDVLALRPGEGALALLLAPKGQFRAIMAVFAGGEQSYLLAPPGRAVELARVLSTYLRLSRCAAEPAPTGGLLAVVGPQWREAVLAIGGATLREKGWLATPGALWFGETLLGVQGAVAAAESPEALAALRSALEATGTRRVAEEAVELARIRVGWPDWGAELTESVLPPEVGIGDVAISYSKGCYVGQETIARMKTYGHPTRALVGLRQVGGSSTAPGLPVPLTAVGEGRARGSLTSWAWHPENGAVALGVVRRELTEAGTKLAGDGRAFKVASFPFW